MRIFDKTVKSARNLISAIQARRSTRQHHFEDTDVLLDSLSQELHQFLLPKAKNTKNEFFLVETFERFLETNLDNIDQYTLKERFDELKESIKYLIERSFSAKKRLIWVYGYIAKKALESELKPSKRLTRLAWKLKALNTSSNCLRTPQNGENWVSEYHLDLHRILRIWAILKHSSAVSGPQTPLKQPKTIPKTHIPKIEELPKDVEKEPKTHENHFKFISALTEDLTDTRIHLKTPKHNLQKIYLKIQKNRINKRITMLLDHSEASKQQLKAEIKAQNRNLDKLINPPNQPRNKLKKSTTVNNLDRATSQANRQQPSLQKSSSINELGLQFGKLGNGQTSSVLGQEDVLKGYQEECLSPLLKSGQNVQFMMDSFKMDNNLGNLFSFGLEGDRGGRLVTEGMIESVEEVGGGRNGVVRQTHQG